MIEEVPDLLYEHPRLIRLISPTKLFRTIRYFDRSGYVRVLDLGCGTHSLETFRAAFPNCSYVGVDRRAYQGKQLGSTGDFHIINDDLEESSLNQVEDESADLVVVSHILEHLRRGLNLLDVAVRKLRTGGILYVAYPNPNSVRFPHRSGTLNFFDDPTHVTIINPVDLKQKVTQLGLTTVEAGISRQARHLALFPMGAVLSMLRGGVPGQVLWDLYGFECYLVARK